MKNFDDVVETTLNRLRKTRPDLDEAQVREVLSYIFDSVGDELASLKHTGIALKNVGSFIMVPDRVSRVMDACMRELDGNGGGNKMEQRRLAFAKAKPVFTDVLRHRDLVRLNRAAYVKSKYGTKVENDEDEDEEDGNDC